MTQPHLTPPGEPRTADEEAYYDARIAAETAKLRAIKYQAGESYRAKEHLPRVAAQAGLRRGRDVEGRE